MSIEAMTLVLNHSRATGRAKLVLIGIANHQGDQGAWPSIETLARYANASERSVMRDIQELEEMGELIVERNAAPVRSQYRPNLYWVNIAAGVTDSASGVTNLQAGVTSQVVRGDTVVTQNIINLKEKPSKYAQDEIERLFDLFWEAYPRKVGKIAARKSFEKALAVCDGQVLIKAAYDYAHDPYLPAQQQFIPHPATWLNRGSWEDGPLPERELTAEEKAIRAKAKAQRDHEIALRESAERKAEQERQRAEMEAHPPQWCEHDRIKAICRKCRRA